MSEFLPLFTRASKLMRSAADAAMARHGVRVGQNLLIDQLASEGGLTPGELAERLGVTTPTVVKMANRMEAAGLVSKRRDERDARLVRLQLTDRGRSLKAPVDDELRRLEERALGDLSADQRRRLERALADVVRNLEQIAPAVDVSEEERQ